MLLAKHSMEKNWNLLYATALAKNPDEDTT